jgi:hypothetical protein
MSPPDPWLGDVLGDPLQAKILENRGTVEPVLRRARRPDERDGRLRNGVHLRDEAGGID